MSKVVIPAGAFENAKEEKSASLLSTPSAFVGIEVNPLGNRSSSGVAYAGWEWWPGTPGVAGSGAFSNQIPDATQTGSTITTANLSQSNTAIGTSPATPSGAPSYSRGGRLTSGGEDGGYSFTLVGKVNFAVSKLVLQVKHSNFLNLVSGTYYGLNWISTPPYISSNAVVPFKAKLNGGTEVSGVRYTNTATESNTNVWSRGSWDPSDGSNTSPGHGGTGTFFFTFQYEWTLETPIAANTDFIVTFYSVEDLVLEGFSVDTVTLDVANS